MKNILVVDDNKLIAEGLAQRIGMAMKDACIHTAENGREAMELMSSTPMDLVMTDLQMPDMDGFDLIDFCQKNRPGTALYAMTADRGPEVVKRLDHLGIAGSVEKPFDFDEVAYQIRDALYSGAESIAIACGEA